MQKALHVSLELEEQEAALSSADPTLLREWIEKVVRLESAFPLESAQLEDRLSTIRNMSNHLEKVPI